MNGNQINTKSPRKERDVKSELTYENDGFFSDVPASGSLSKSLFALNKYVKKNLLYEENESDNDEAYFSKESTPKKSAVKYYSDSVQSSDSGEKEEVVKVPINTTTFIAKANQIRKTSALPIATVTNINDMNKTSPDYDKKITQDSLNDIPFATEQTDDYKFKQLRDNSNNRANKKSVAVIEYTDNWNEPNNLSEQKSISLDDSTVDYGTATYTDNSTSENVVHRDKKHVTIKENRHTVHDASDWVNRTDMYPDVYAPLPYSKLFIDYDINFSVTPFLKHSEPSN